jgi:dihydroorotase
LPVLKREPHRRALVKAATSGQSEVLPRHRQRAALEGREGKLLRERGHVYGARGARALRRSVRCRRRARKLEGFASHFGADFYGLPRNKGTVTLERVDWSVPESYPLGAETVVPLRAGQKIAGALFP